MSNLFHDSNNTVGELTKKLASKLTDLGLRLTTAESCTGGKLSVVSDEAKARILGVRPETLARFTAVSEQTVTEMAASIRDIAQADISIAISGYAGPEGGDDGTAAGTVCFAWNIRGETKTRTVLFSGDCQDVVEKAVHYALAELVTTLSDGNNE